MSERIFLAGATGAIGSALIPLLREAGYEVHGSTRQPERAAALEAQGVKPVLVDVFDAAALKAALVRIAPHGVIHQLTDLPRGLDPARMAEATARNARVRTEGTRNLVEAARAAGAVRMVAQSIAWAYAPGPKPYTEAQPLDTEAEGARRVSVGGVVALEQAVLHAPGITGTVLRYGQLYGPGTGADEPKGASPVHVEAAAWAALLAWRHSAGGVFNIAEDNPEVDSGKARRLLGWTPSMRLGAEARS
ncbi:NAD(P)-dependent oxidoreductase [Variovorax paradoxus]|uniref:NAD-dependent epimerase/dehydratase family protein n=1 Tax=Variovorax paradoxus TaxID=34073 RepID=UPI001933D54C|nr:NAD(P)-dependent oxidoreductase [Variovorax paradoxus]